MASTFTFCGQGLAEFFKVMGGPDPQGVTLGLFINDVSPTFTSVLGDFDSPTNDQYGEFDMGLIFNAPTIADPFANVDGIATWDLSDSGGSPFPQTVYGITMIAAGSALLAAGRFPLPINMGDGSNTTLFSSVHLDISQRTS